MALTDNIVAYWKLDGNSNDSVGSNNGTDSNISYDNAYGKINQGADFNGTSSKIVTGSSFATGAGAKSFSVWFNHDDAANRGWIVAGGTDANDQAFGLFMDSDNLIFHGNGGSADMTVISGVTQDTWYHIVITYDGTTLKSYINGSAGPTKTYTYNTTGTGIWLGARKNGDVNGWFDGFIDEFGVWSRAITSTEVTQLYNAGAGKQYPFSALFTILDTVTTTDTTSSIRARLFSTLDSLSITDAISALKGISFSILDAVTTSDIVTTARTFTFNVLDAVGVTDAFVEIRKKWNNLSKNSSSWANNSKSSSNWTNQDKTQ